MGRSRSQPTVGKPARTYDRHWSSRTRTGSYLGPRICLTLEEDEVTRCGRPVGPFRTRCRFHQEQYRRTYLKYKEASWRAGYLRETTLTWIPTTREIADYDDIDTVRRKIELVYKYLELVETEKIGRDIHGRRFFLTRAFLFDTFFLNFIFNVGDDPHMDRLNMLEDEIRRTSRAFLALRKRAHCLFSESFLRERDSSRADTTSDQTKPTRSDCKRSSGTTVLQGTVTQAPQSHLSFARRCSAQLADFDDAEATNLDSGSESSDSDAELDWIEIECVTGL